MDAPTFDLVDERWVPVVVRGLPRLVSLRECLLTAHEIDLMSSPRSGEAARRAGGAASA